jgi:hypothetical protein
MEDLDSVALALEMEGVSSNVYREGNYMVVVLFFQALLAASRKGRSYWAEDTKAQLFVAPAMSQVGLTMVASSSRTSGKGV